MLSAEAIAPVKTVPLKRREYHHLAELGAYEGHRVQLVFGTVIDMSPMGNPHANAVRVLNRVFVTLAPREIEVSVQLPLAASEDSEPEPDFAFGFKPSGIDADHPTSALLLIEVADSSLKLDLGPKATLYATCQVPEYWVIDLKNQSTVVHRTPQQGKYSSVKRVPWSRTLTSTSVPAIEVRLAELLWA